MHCPSVHVSNAFNKVIIRITSVAVHLNKNTQIIITQLFVCICIYTQHKISMTGQDSKCYMSHPTVQVQSDSQITDMPLTARLRLKDDHLSKSLMFFNLPLGIGPNDIGPPCIYLYLGLNVRHLCS